MPPSAPSPPAYLTAVITGSSSGIGLALAAHLLSISSSPPWRILLCDINPHTAETSIETLLSQGHHPSRIQFLQTDVSSFSANASAFKTAWLWDDLRRVDFFAANAGVSLKGNGVVDFFPNENPTNDDEDGEGPMQPDLRVIDTNLKSVYYGLKCFLWYIRKTRNLMLLSHSSPSPSSPRSMSYNPKMVITASCTSLYGFPVDPPYASAKAGLVNLVHSLSAKLFLEDNLSLNAVCPGVVVTNIMSVAVQESAPHQRRTPMDVLMKAYDELIEGVADVEENEGNSDRRKGKYGIILETSGSKLYHREKLPYCDENMKWIIEDPDGYWSGELLKRGEKEMQRQSSNKGPPD